MTTWQILALILGGLVLVLYFERRRWKKLEEYTKRAIDGKTKEFEECAKRVAADEMMKRFEEINTARKLELEATEKERAMKLFVCFVDGDKDRIELIQFLTKSPSPQQVVCDALNFYEAAVKERRDGCLLGSFDEATRILKLLHTESLDNVQKKIEG